MSTPDPLTLRTHAPAGAVTQPAPPPVGFPAPIEQLGRYAVAGRLGAGGMGEVLEATDPDLGRTIAAKVIRAGARDGALERFVREARITGQLEHPHIMPVHELALTPDGRPYFTMKRIEGSDLACVLDAEEEGPPLPELLQLFLKITDAVAFAHSRGVIHRDLKPANVMIGAFGEVLVCDWGLARVLATDESWPTDDSEGPSAATPASPTRTQEGSVLGTPAYMPPEQAAGRIADVDERSDVYALGAILYEILARTPPYSGGSAWDVIVQVLEGPPPPPSARALRRVPRELEAITLRAMAPAQDDRYPSATALARDVTAYLDGRRVSAARYSAAQHAARWVRRHPTAAMALTLIALFLAAGGATASALVARRAAAERLAADEREARRESDERARAAELLALARAGRIDELIGQLGGQRRAARDVAVVEFEELSRRLKSEGKGDEQIAADIGEPRLRAYLAAFDELFDSHALYPAQIAVTAVDYFHRAFLHNCLDNHEAALADYDKAIGLDPSDSAAFNNRGLARQALGQLEAAVADYDHALELAPRQKAALLNRGFVRWRQGRFEAAIADYDRAIAIDPDYVDVLHNRGVARRACGQLEAAIADFDHAVRLAPRKEIYLARGDAWSAMGRLAEAIADFDRAIELDPWFKEAFNGRGNARRSEGQLDLALADYDRAIELDPRFATAFANRAQVRHALGQLDAAIADCDLAIELDPRNRNAYATRGAVRQGRGELSPALADYDRAIELDPRSADGFVLRGELRKALGELEAAIVDHDRAIELDPRLPGAFSNRGSARLAQGRLDLALADFDRALALDPEFWQARANRGVALWNKGQAAEALAELEDAWRRCPSAEGRQQVASVISGLGGKVPEGR